jgi:hypothetical protein
MSLHRPLATSRRGDSAIGGVAVVGILLMAAAAYLGFTFAPVWFDYLAVKEIGGTVVLDWVNHESEDQARARLLTELERKGVSKDLDEKKCRFIDKAAAYEVDCAWTQYAYYPGTDYYKAVPLRVHVALVDGKARVLSD